MRTAVPFPAFGFPGFEGFVEHFQRRLSRILDKRRGEDGGYSATDNVGGEFVPFRLFLEFGVCEPLSAGTELGQIVAEGGIFAVGFVGPGSTTFGHCGDTLFPHFELFGGNVVRLDFQFKFVGDGSAFSKVFGGRFKEKCFCDEGVARIIVENAGYEKEKLDFAIMPDSHYLGEEWRGGDIVYQSQEGRFEVE